MFVRKVEVMEYWCCMVAVAVRKFGSQVVIRPLEAPWKV